MCTALLCLFLSGAPSTGGHWLWTTFYTFFFFYTFLAYLPGLRSGISPLKGPPQTIPTFPLPPLDDSIAQRCIFLRCIQPAHFSKTQNSPTSRGQTLTRRHQGHSSVFLFIKNICDLSNQSKMSSSEAEKSVAQCWFSSLHSHHLTSVLLLFQTRLCCRPGRPHA